MKYVNETNANRAATRKQLWALYCITKKDYRNENLTMQQASEMIEKFNAAKVVGNIGVNNMPTSTKVVAKPSKPTLEQEFISYMTERMHGVIAVCKDAIKIKSVVEDDATIFTDASKRNKYAFFGFGCGISIIKFDKRSKLGKTILELGAKHRNTTFLQMFLKGFTKEQINYFHEVGFPLEAMYNQDIRISGKYENAVADFMREKGVKNVHVHTYYD
jgi:hypothetical protein